MNWLTDRQLVALTRRRQPAAQIRVLREAGIPHRVVDGRPVVMAADVAPGGERRDTQGPRLRLA